MKTVPGSRFQVPGDPPLLTAHRSLVTGHRLLIALLLLPCSLAFGQSARQELDTGAKAYEEGNYPDAATAFDRSAQQAEKEKLDAAVAYYNQANALYQARQFDQAIPLYLNALKTPDLNLQSQAYFNRGNALMGQSAQQEQAQKLDDAVKSVDEALLMYENSMSLASGDIDAKVNYELALKKKEELKQLQQQQQQQQQQNQDQNKDDQEKQDQQQQQDKQDPQQQQDPQQKQDQQQQPDQQKQEQEQAQQGEQEQQEQQQSPQPEQFEEMTPEEARMVLDAMKEDEQAQRDPRLMMQGQPVPVDKDW